MAKKVVTLYIDDISIRLLVAKGKRVQKWARLPLEPGLVKDGVILDETQVVDKLKELFTLTNVSPGKVIAGLSGLNSLYRLITLPELPEAVREEAVKHEARRVIPVSLDQVHLAHQALPAAKGETLLFLTAFPRNAADALIKTLRQAGVEPYLMDLAPLALCRNVNEPRAIIVNLWSANLDIVIMADRLPQVIRSLSVPSDATSLSGILPTITEELERTIAFYNSSHLEQPLDSTVPLLVSGDLAETPESWQSLTGEAGYSVSALTSPMEYPDGFDPSQFMVNIGLVLKELQPEQWEGNFSLVNFNALPGTRLSKGRPKVGILIPIAIAAIGIGALVYAVPIVQNSMAQTADVRFQLQTTQDLVAQQQKHIAALREQIAQIPPPEPLEAAALVFETTFTNLGEVRELVDKDLSQIASLAPADIALLYGGDKVTISAGPLSDADISHSIEQVTVTGRALDEAAIFKYARALRSSGRFYLVVISSIEAYEEIIVEEEVDEEDWEVVTGFNFVFLLISNTSG